MKSINSFIHKNQKSMQKLLVLLAVVFTTICLSSCYQEQQVKHHVKNFLAENSNDGKVEIVSFTCCEDTVYYNASKIALLEKALNYFDTANKILDEAQIDLIYAENQYELDSCQSKMDKAALYKHKADSVSKLADKIEPTEYLVYKATVKARGKNAFGKKVINDCTVFYNPKNKKCDFDRMNIIK